MIAVRRQQQQIVTEGAAQMISCQTPRILDPPKSEPVYSLMPIAVPSLDTPVERRKVVGIVGGHSHNTTAEAMNLAEQVGFFVAQAGFVVATGGFDGVMEAALRGAKRAGGTTMAILKGNNKDSANRFADICIATSLDLAFMHVLVWTADVVIAFEGNYGTLTEIALALEIGRPLALLGNTRHLETTTINSDAYLSLPDMTASNQARLVSYFKRHALL